MATEMQQTDCESELSDLSDLSDLIERDDSSRRPNKRMRMNEDKPYAVASASAIDKSAPASTNKHLITPLPSSPAIAQSEQSDITTVLVPSTTRLALSSPLPSTLLAPPKRVVDDKDRTSATHNKDSLKMTILPKSEYDSLKAHVGTLTSHNNILRSHNLSLSRQNKNLRHDNAKAIVLYEEIKEMGPIDHSRCVRKDDYDQLLAENQTLTNQMAQLRYEHQLMKECGFEWARRENLWEVEQQLLKTEVTSLVKRVNDFKAREQMLVDRIGDLEGRVRAAEGRADEERARVIELLEQIRRGQAAAADGAVRKSGYPEL